MTDTQTITIETVVGPKTYLAPAGWDFSNTLRRRVWRDLLKVTAEDLKDTRGPNAHGKIAARATIGTLATLLSQDMGKARFYWEEEACRIAGLEA